MLTFLSKIINLFFPVKKDKYPIDTPINSLITVEKSSIYILNKYHQKFDENYDSEIGQEYLNLCLNHQHFPDYNSLGYRLWTIRKQSSLRQVDVAKFLGISSSTISSYENNRTVPNDITITKLAYHYSVPKTFVLYGWAEDFIEHLTLCKKYDESNYIESLYFAIKGANRYFSDKLSPAQQAKCNQVIATLNFNFKQ